MSRRCDREGVEWDDRCAPWERATIRAGHAPDVLWDLAEWRETIGTPQDVNAVLMQHLRERPMLPPWLDVTLHGRPVGRFSVVAWVDALSQFVNDAKRRRAAARAEWSGTGRVVWSRREEMDDG